MHRSICGVCALLVALIGCAQLNEITANVCGNGVAESGEDCDLFVDPSLGDNTECGQPTATRSEQRCRYVCTDSDDACPTGWSCDGTGVCHFASGAFLEAGGSPVDIVTSGLQLGDVDGDNALDLIGASDVAVQVRYGTGAGQFPTAFSLATPPRQGEAVFGRLDGDLFSDALIPVDLGVMLLRGESDGSLSPIALSFELPSLVVPGPMRVLGLEPPSSEPLDTGSLFLFLYDGPEFFQASLIKVELTTVAGGDFISGIEVVDTDNYIVDGTRMVGNMTPPARGEIDTDADEDGGDLVIAFRGDTVVIVTGVVDDNGSLDLGSRDFIFFSSFGTVRSGTHLADVDGDGASDVLISITANDGEERILVATGRGDGTFNAPAIDPRFDILLDDCLLDATAGLINPDLCSRFPIAASDINRDGVADYVNPNAVYLTDENGALERITDRLSPSPWSEMVVADFNADGEVDLATVSNANPGVDFLLGNGTGVFTHSRVSTDGTPSSLRPGDFDGDQITDLVFVEPAGVRDSVSVIFGEALMLPSDVVTMARFDDVRYVEVGRAGFPLDLPAEFLVDTSDETGNRLSPFFGAAERQMVSPMIFNQDSTDLALLTPNVALLGDFLPGDGDGVRDIAVLTELETSPELWFGVGPITDRSPSLGAGISLDAELDSFARSCALWAVGDINGDGGDEIIAVDNADRCYREGSTPDPPQLLIIEPTSASGYTATITALPDNLTVPRELQLADVDGDGGLDVIISFAGEHDTDGCESTANAGVAVYWSAATDVSSRSLLTAELEGQIPATAVLNADDDAARELAIWTAAGVVVANITDSREFFVEPLEVNNAPLCSATLLAGDVSGDGLDDLVIAGQRSAEVHLAVSHLLEELDDEPETEE